jgi:hypothetical protein
LRALFIHQEEGIKLMAQLKNQNKTGKVEGAFGKEKPSEGHEPLTPSGGTPGSTPAPGKSKGADPDDRDT